MARFFTGPEADLRNLPLFEPATDGEELVAPLPANRDAVKAFEFLERVRHRFAGRCDGGSRIAMGARRSAR